MGYLWTILEPMNVLTKLLKTKSINVNTYKLYLPKPMAKYTSYVYNGQ